MFLFWQAPPTEHQNGIIREYHVEVMENSTSGTHFNYITESPYLLVDNLIPEHDYICTIAAYSTRKGPYSQPIIVTLNLENCTMYYCQTVTTKCKFHALHCTCNPHSKLP